MLEHRLSREPYLKAERQQQLTDDELKFLQDYQDRLEHLIGKIAAQPSAPVRAFLAELFRPSTWKLLAHLGKAEELVEQVEAAQSKDRSVAIDKEFERRALAVSTAINDFGEFLERRRPDR